MDAALREVDSDIADAVERELGRQRDTLELIASENFAPLAVLQAQGSVLTNKYAEGYPAAATTAAANTWTSWRASPSSEPNGCSVRSTPTCSRTPVPRRALRCSVPSRNPATRFSGSTLPMEDTSRTE